MNTKICPFCDIEELQTRTVKESNYFRAITSLRPLADDHVMILTKEHRDDLSFLSEDESHALIDFVQEILKDLKSTEKYNGYNVFTNIGERAGQHVMHFHLHILPRSESETESPFNKINKKE